MTNANPAQTRRELFLIRHGETRSNREGIFRGRLDIPLSVRGEEQARALRNADAVSTIVAVTSSPLVRAQATARIAFPDLPLHVDERLNNLDLGEWSGKRKQDVKRDFPDEWRLWVQDPHAIRFPGGESLREVHERARLFLDWFRRSDRTPMAAITHRSVIKCLLGTAMGMARNYFWKFHLDNASITRLVWEPGRGFTLTGLNHTGHLPGVVTEWY
ncbi:MAG: histidine phosphatase family protein [Acidobacteriota bacterium]|jgi:probable phosphoglycerate mutase|nr:histidine phosphatase family protein [Acidobacteriota bacterium]